MKKLYRSKDNRQLCGVCGGIAEYLNIDSTVVRLLAVVLGLCTAVFGALIFYIIAAVVIPEEPDYYDV
ncbi:MAG: PspC domain-containing protein [Bacillota bacterium]|jgi:phage shock protein C